MTCLITSAILVALFLGAGYLINSLLSTILPYVISAIVIYVIARIYTGQH